MCKCKDILQNCKAKIYFNVTKINLCPCATDKEKCNEDKKQKYLPDLATYFSSDRIQSGTSYEKT